MNTTLKKAIDFAKNLEGELTQDKINELTNLVHCVQSEVENTSNLSNNPALTLRMEYETMVYDLLLRMAFMQDDYNRRIRYAINNLNSK